MADSWLDGDLPTVGEIRRRLNLTIPGALDPSGYALRELAAKTIFVMLYGFAVEGLDRWIRPTAVTDMTDVQAAEQDSEKRRYWLKTVQGRSRPKNVPGRWYSENTRESIRDETLRTLVTLNVVVTRQGLPTTSPAPRYAIAEHFVDLLSPRVKGQALAHAIEKWQSRHLSKTALARLVLLRKGTTKRGKGVLVSLPNGEKRRLAPGPSSELTKAAVELLAGRFLKNPAVVMISESAQKLTYQDDQICKAIGFELRISGTLPDIVLVDVGAEHPLMVFVECVVTDGPVSERRRRELEDLARASGFHPKDCTYVTVFRDRADSPFRSMAASLAWGSFVWFATEPEQILILRDSRSEEPLRTLSDLLLS
jgi:BsuBI/PstI restriction endonuclease domain/BsuBI/PstI restriction endonuclease HTH domain